MNAQTAQHSPRTETADRQDQVRVEQLPMDVDGPILLGRRQVSQVRVVLGIMLGDPNRCGDFGRQCVGWFRPPNPVLLGRHQQRDVLRQDATVQQGVDSARHDGVQLRHAPVDGQHHAIAGSRSLLQRRVVQRIGKRSRNAGRGIVERLASRHVEVIHDGVQRRFNPQDVSVSVAQTDHAAATSSRCCKKSPA